MRYIPRVSLYEGSLNRGFTLQLFFFSVKHATVSAWRWGWVKEKIDARTPRSFLRACQIPPKKKGKNEKTSGAGCLNVGQSYPPDKSLSTA